MRALVAGKSGSCLCMAQWGGGGRGVLEGGRMGGEHRCEGAADTDFADAANVRGTVKKTWGKGAGALSSPAGKWALTSALEPVLTPLGGLERV